MLRTSMFYTSAKARRNRLYSLIVTIIISFFFGIFGFVRSPDGWPWWSGFTCLLALGIYLFLTRKFRRRARLLQSAFPEQWRQILNNRVGFYRRLDGAERRQFEDDIRIFLAEKRITGIKTEIDATTRLLVAASAVIPIFGFPEWEYDNLAEVLIYPTSFNQDKQFDEHLRRNILGMVHTSGALNRIMILSKEDLFDGFDQEESDRHVGLHEFAHILDAADGAVDGIPLGIKRECLQPWLQVMAAEIERLEEGRSGLDPYALTNRGEFFAVATEAFFKTPQQMMRDHPQLYRVLKCVFEQDMKSKFKSTVRSMIRPYIRRTWGNASCPCGSGRPYRNCCGKEDPDKS